MMFYTQNVTKIRRRGELKTKGVHIILELFDCDKEILNDRKKIEEIMLEATKQSGAKIVSYTFHKFNPHGVSGVVVIAESHLSIHTWPEVGYAATDVYTCGEDVMPDRAVEYLKKNLKAKKSTAIEMKRGLIDE